MLGGIVAVKTEAVDLSKDCREWKWLIYIEESVRCSRGWRKKRPEREGVETLFITFGMCWQRRSNTCQSGP